MRVYARLERFGTGKVEQIAVAEQDAHEHRADLDVGDLVKTYQSRATRLATPGIHSPIPGRNHPLPHLSISFPYRFSLGSDKYHTKKA